jgi:hypothetical protein
MAFGLPSPIAILAGAALAQDPEPAAPAAEARPARPGFEQFFGDDTLAFAGIDDLEAFYADLAASPWGRLAADPRAEGVRTTFVALLAAIGAESKAETGVDVIEMLRKLDGRLGLGIAGTIDPEDVAASRGDSRAVLAADAAAAVAEVEAALLALFEKMVEEGKSVLKNEPAANGAVVTLTPTSEEDRGRISLSSVGETIALGVDVGRFVEGDDFHRFLAALGGEGRDTLAQLPEFRASVASAAGGVKLFVNVGAALRAAAAAAEAQEEASREELELNRALGLTEFGALAAHLRLGAAGGDFVVAQDWGGGWIPRLANAWLGDVDDSTFKLIPTTVQSAFAIQVDLAQGIAAAEEAAKELGDGPIPGLFDPAPQDPAALADEELQARRDFLDHLDGRLAVYLATADEGEGLPLPIEGAASMNFALIIGVKNAEALSASLDKLLRDQGLHAARRRSEFEGFQVYTLPIAPVNITYSFAQDVLVVSLAPSFVHDVLRRKSNAELECIAKDETFTSQVAGLGRSAALLAWSRSGEGLIPRSALQGAFGNPYDELGYTDESGEESGGAEPDTSVEGRAQAFIEAIAMLDDAVIAEHFTGSQLMALSVDQGGARLEVVYR